MDESKNLPLCIDLDQSLVRTDLLWESLLGLIRTHPWKLLLVPWWLRRGRAYLKRTLAERGHVDVTSLPYRISILEYAREQRSCAREVFLVTAADSLFADAVARHLGCFTGVIASNGKDNLKGDVKAIALTNRFGARGFDYIGDGPADLKVWENARYAFLAEVNEGLRKKIEKRTTLARSFDHPRPRVQRWLRAMRLHQWTKNLILIVPVITSHKWRDLHVIEQDLNAVIAFSLTASSVYILNDLFDLEADRLNPVKKNRPFACGDVSIKTGLILAGVLVAMSVLLAMRCGPVFTEILFGYFMVTLAYSLFLKRLVLVDVILLASLYTLRLLAGGAATGIGVSTWLLAFSMFFFFGLALIKRYSELLQAGTLSRNGLERRGYKADDLDSISVFGISSGFSSILVFVLYIKSPEVMALYKAPAMLLLGCPLLLYWTTRMWLLAKRGLVSQDPVVFTLTDKTSYLVGLAFLLIILLAST